MYKSIYIDKKSDIVYLWDDTEGATTFPFPHYAYKKQKGGKYRSIHGDELVKTDLYEEGDTDLYESDLPPETKILMEAYDDSDEPSIDHNIVVIDIEVDSEGGFPNVERGDKEITAISIYDSLTKKYYAFVLDKNKLLTNSNEGDVILSRYDDEETMLRTFLNVWEQLSPSIVTGWNINDNGTSGGFDMPYLYNRLKVVVGTKNANRLSPIGVCYMRRGEMKLIVAGVSLLDYIRLYKKFSNKTMPNLQLNTVGKIVVGMEKIHYDGNLDDLYKNDIKKYIEYNLQDVRIVVALDEKLKFIDLARRICHIGHVPYEWFHMSSRYLEGAIILHMRRNGGYIAPNKPVGGREQYMEQEYGDDDDDNSFAGAYVKDPVPGLYDWIFSCDINSLYPSIIRTLNISPETKAGRVKNFNVNIIESNWNGSVEIELDKGKENIQFDSKSDFLHFLESKKLTISSAGILFYSEKEGVVPQILSNWFAERVELKNKMKDAYKNNDKQNYEFYKQRQQSLKIMLNSLYGTLGLPLFRFYDKENAESVTLSGQTIIKMSEKKVNQIFYKKTNKNDDHIKYIDTDSLYMSSLDVMPSEYKTDLERMNFTISLSNDISNQLNEFYPLLVKKIFNASNNKIRIQSDSIASTAIWLAKKRYALLKCYDMELEKEVSKSDGLEVKGIDVVRTSFPVKFREFMKSFLMDILNKTERKIIDEKILRFKSDLSTFNIIDISKNTSVKFISQKGDINYCPKGRQPFSIVTGTPAQTKAALYYNDLLRVFGLHKKIEPIHHSQKIKYAYLKENEYGIDCLALKADSTDPKQMLDFVEKYIDRNKLYERELESKLKSFYEVLNWQLPTEEIKKAGEFFNF